MAGIAIGILIASAWIASSRSRRVAPLEPPAVEDAIGQHRESAALDVAHAGDAHAAGSAREVPPAPGIHGRLIDASTGAPLAGWTIRLEHRPDPPEPVTIQIAASQPRYSKGVLELPAVRAVQLGNEIVEVSAKDAPMQGESHAPSAPADTTGAGVSDERVRLQLFSALRAIRTAQEQAARTAAEPGSSQPTAPEATTAEPNVPEPTSPMLITTEQLTPAPAAPEWIASTSTDAASAPAPSETNAGTTGFRLDNVDLRVTTTPEIAQELARATLERAMASQDDTNAQVFSRFLAQYQGSAELRFAAALGTQFGPPIERAEPSVTQAECVTDADGRFDLPCPDHDDAWLALEPRPPLHPDPKRYALHGAADACARFIEWKTHLVERAVMHARVVDAATGEPVPWLDVVVASSDRRETLTSQADGRFASRKPLPTGTVRVSFSDGPTQLDSAHELGRAKVVPVRCDQPTAVLDASGDELVFRVAIGPTWRFTLPNGIEPDVVVARVRGLAARNVHDAGALDGDWHAMRHEDEWFVRMPVPVRASAEAPPSLEVWIDDLHWARVGLTHFEGRGERAELPLALGARLHGRVIGDEDASVAGARIELLGRDGSVLDATTSDAEGAWQLVGVDPSTFSRIRVVSGNISQTASVPVHAGDDRELDVTLGAQPR